MYPTLYHALSDLFGWEIAALKLINSFGLFVALAFVGAAFTLRREIDRKQSLGIFQPTQTTLTIGGPVSWTEYLSQAVVGFILGWKLIYLALNAEVLFQSGLPQRHLFSLEGSPILGLIIAAIFVGWRYWESRKSGKKLSKETVYIPANQHVGGIVTVAAIGGITGAKFFHLLEYPEEMVRFFREPSLQNFLGGLTIYGGLIVGGLSVYIYALRNNLKFLPLADATAPGLMLAYGIGRIGCQVSGDGDWGIPNSNPKPDWMGFLPDWMWSYSFPNNVNGVYGARPAGYTGRLIGPDDPWPIFEGYGTYLDPGVYPTAFYETLMCLIIFGLLWSVRRRIVTPGRLFALYCVFNGLERFFIEKIRVNVEMDLLGMHVTQAEVISTITFLSGLTLWAILGKRRKR
ncbi:MAG: diacylglyceryl transferase [Crocinitomicaceae bacterium]|nr:diacylglyceryl transferase [Crocinitomicaceae bacterium]